MVLSHTEKSSIASYYGQIFSNKIKRMENKNLKVRSYKTGNNLIIFNLNIRGKLSIIRRNNYCYIDLSITFKNTVFEQQTKIK